MRPPHLLLLALVVAPAALLLGSSPAHAQRSTAPVTDSVLLTDTVAMTETVTAYATNTWLVDARSAELPTLLPEDEVARIEALLAVSEATTYKIQSPVSPDDQTVLVTQGSGSSYFLNLQDGSSVAVQAERLRTNTNFVWLDDDTLGFLAFDPISQSGTVVGAAVDRGTGAITYGDARLDAAAALSTKKTVVALLTPGLRKVLIVDSTNALPNPIFKPSETGFADGAGSGWGMLPPNDMFLFAEGAKLMVADLESGEQQELITLGHNIKVLDIAFTPDGNLFSVTTMWEEFNRTLDITGGPRLTDFTYRDVTGQLPPAANPYFTENRVTVLDFAGGERRELRAADGDGGFYTTANWSPDGQTLMVKVNRPGNAAGREFPQYYPEFQSGAGFRFYDAHLNELQRLDRPEIDSTELRAAFVSPDEVVIETRYFTNGHPYYYNLSTGEFRNLADREGVFHFVTPTNQSREIVFTYSTFADPPEFFRMGLDGAGVTQLTTLNADVAEVSHIAQYPVSFTLSSGAVFPGVLVLPDDVPFPPQDVPIVVWQAGGPTFSVPNSWRATVEGPQALLPNFGFGVLVVPIYGRYGVGPENFSALVDNADFGQADIAVQAEIVDQLRSLGWASKVGITGCSYGGYFAVQSVVSYPNTYDAAHTMCSIVDMILEWNTGDGILGPWVMGDTPWAAYDEFRLDSPIYQALNIRTPLLAFHGTNDFLPVDVMLNLMLKVIGNGADAKMLIFQGSGHSFASAPAKLKDAYELYGAQQQILWFREHLGE